MLSRCQETETGHSPGVMEGEPGVAAPEDADTCTGAAGELTLAVLAPAGPPQMTIFGYLDQTDTLNLGATCITLHQASLEWFSDVTVLSQPPDVKMPALEAWLKRHKACLYVTSSAQLRASTNSITALPAAAVTSLTVQTYSSQPTALSTLTALTSLELRGPCGNAQQRISAQLLQPLTRLQHLSLRQIDLACSGQQLLSLPSVRVLKMEGCRVKSTPLALLILAQLTHVSPSRHRMTATAPSATLQPLVHLALVCCRLKAVPEQLSALTALTRLDLAGNSLRGGWQRLLPLTRLQELDLRGCLLQAVPQQVSGLTALTRLDLNANKQLDGGWQHLLPLTQLRELNYMLCGLTAVPEQVSALTALTRLALSHNSLTAVPQHLSALRNLAYLSLCFNNVSSGFQHLLPLTGLTRLTLSREPVPAELASLPRLRISYVLSPPPSATPLQACIAALILLGLWVLYLVYGWLA